MAWGLLALLAAGCADDGSGGPLDPPTEPPAPPEEPPPPPPAPTPPGLVLVIGDGMGFAHLEATRRSVGELVLDDLPVAGALLTASASSDVTDSGASATALSTGHATYNGAIGVDADTIVRPTILEMAEGLGMATGLLATSSVTHATPAAFAAHVVSRSDQMTIALQMTGSGVDVLLGGGRRYFEAATRPDGEELTERWTDRGCAVVDPTLDPPSGTTCALGLFAEDGMPPVDALRSPGLPEMTALALELLLDDPEGFFLMVEGSQIDWAGHDNDGPRMVAEVEELDRAVRLVLEAVQGRENTLVVVTSDHETGGLSVATGPGGEVELQWSTSRHTGVPVPLFAQGPGAEVLADTLSNDRVGRELMRWLEEASGGG